MDRAVLVNLFQQGMRYPQGRRRLWVVHCFEITTRTGRRVELDEYEGASLGRGPDDFVRHIGRTRLELSTGRVLEEPGTRQPLPKGRGLSQAV